MHLKAFRKDYGATSFITGLRAYAVLITILIHAGGAGLYLLGPLGERIVGLGRTGVYMFFVISGFSVANSYIHSKGFGDFLSRRLWRIAPLYYFWLIIMVAFGNTEVSLYNFLMHVSFLSFADSTIANSILMVEWSIPVEIVWYIFTPVLVMLTLTSQPVAGGGSHCSKPVRLQLCGPEHHGSCA